MKTLWVRDFLTNDVKNFLVRCQENVKQIFFAGMNIFPFTSGRWQRTVWLDEHAQEPDGDRRRRV
jgi:hypothetical protein